jgi:hypothetical protein
VEAKTFGELHFGDADLGDVRRTKRLVRIADGIARIVKVCCGFRAFSHFPLTKKLLMSVIAVLIRLSFWNTKLPVDAPLLCDHLMIVRPFWVMR